VRRKPHDAVRNWRAGCVSFRVFGAKPQAAKTRKLMHPARLPRKGRRMTPKAPSSPGIALHRPPRTDHRPPLLHRPPSSIVMPRANTELTSLLADDDTVFVRRKSPPRRNETLRAPGVASESPHVAFSGTQAESLAVLSQQLTDAGAENSHELHRVQDAWPMLPRPVQAAILALVDATLT